MAIAVSSCNAWLGCVVRAKAAVRSRSITSGGHQHETLAIGPDSVRVGVLPRVPEYRAHGGTSARVGPAGGPVGPTQPADESAVPEGLLRGHQDDCFEVAAN